jgi:para-nitrobenzyl esterase
MLEAQQRVFLSLAPEVRGIPFQPVVDGDVLPREPFDAIREGLSRDVSVLAGTCLDEMKLFAFMDPALTELDEAALLARCEKTVIGGEPRRAIEVYREERGRRGESVLPRDLWLAMESDRLMRFPAMRLAELQSRRQRQTYAFLFTWTSPWGGGALGACHALDLPLVFGTVDSRGLREFAGAGLEAQALVEKIQHAWIAFARSSDPSHPGIGEWPAYDGEGRATMLLGKECRTVYAPLEAERAFWESTRVCP